MNSSTVLRHLLLLGYVFALPSFAAQIYLTGNASDVSPETQGFVCLAGGGEDEDWGQGWKRLLESANGGDVVIIRANTGRGEYEDWIYSDSSRLGFPKVNSVRTINLQGPEDANLASVARAVNKAELVFFAGGNQALYIDWLRNSRLLKAVETRMKEKKIPVAGSSAGMAIMGGIDFSAAYPSPKDLESNVTSEDVTSDPTGSHVSLDTEVLTAPFLQKAIMETHFSERDRRNRLMGFMAKASYLGLGRFNEVKGIGADEGTAFCYDHRGIGEVIGTGSVYFLRGERPIERVSPGRPLYWYQNQEAVKVYVIDGQTSHGTFDLSLWSGRGGREEYWWVDNRD